MSGAASCSSSYYPPSSAETGARATVRMNSEMRSLAMIAMPCGSGTFLSEEGKEGRRVLVKVLKN